ncbi:MAG: hypothetical protein IPM26_16630 [Saprospiraceae bacterium]|nr:hypothetical protein [Saprospiraceae bacterium]
MVEWTEQSGGKAVKERGYRWRANCVVLECLHKELLHIINELVKYGRTHHKEIIICRGAYRDSEGW